MRVTSSFGLSFGSAQSPFTNLLLQRKKFVPLLLQILLAGPDLFLAYLEIK